MGKAVDTYIEKQKRASGRNRAIWKWITWNFRKKDREEIRQMEQNMYSIAQMAELAQKIIWRVVVGWMPFAIAGTNFINNLAHKTDDVSAVGSQVLNITALIFGYLLFAIMAYGAQLLACFLVWLGGKSGDEVKDYCDVHFNMFWMGLVALSGQALFLTFLILSIVLGPDNSFLEDHMDWFII